MLKAEHAKRGMEIHCGDNCHLFHHCPKNAVKGHYSTQDVKRWLQQAATDSDAIVRCCSRVAATDGASSRLIMIVITGASNNLPIISASILPHL